MRRKISVVSALSLLFAMSACDEAGGRATAPWAPEAPEEEAISYIEGLDLGPLVAHLEGGLQDTPTDAAPEDDAPPDETPTDDGDPGEPSPPEDPPSGGACDGFSCADGTCIEADWVCDEFPDCAGGDDEFDCGSEEPTCDGFTCADGSCIEAEWVCDGFADCGSEEDEAACGIANPGVGDLGTPPQVAALDRACVAEFAVAGGLAGVTVATSAGQTCKIVGARSPGYGTAAAIVCHASEWTGVTGFVGTVLGTASGTLAGATVCEGGALNQLSDGIRWLFGRDEIPTIVVEARNADDTSDIQGLGQSSLTCPGPAVETAYKDPSACGEKLTDLECRGSMSCEQLELLANRNLLCHWGRIIATNTFHGGVPDAAHAWAIRTAGKQYDYCDDLIIDNCDFDNEAMYDAEGQERATALICG